MSYPGIRSRLYRAQRPGTVSGFRDKRPPLQLHNPQQPKPQSLWRAILDLLVISV